jgi:hypothetical protein
MVCATLHNHNHLHRRNDYVHLILPQSTYSTVISLSILITASFAYVQTQSLFHLFKENESWLMSLEFGESLRRYVNPRLYHIISR